MASDEIGYELPVDDDQADFVRLRQRTWSAAAPYLAGAVVAWVAAGFTEYRLATGYNQEQDSSPILRQTILQTLVQVLLFAGLALFVIGLLVAVLRQHERWRRDLELALDDAPAGPVGVAAPQRHDRPVDVSPAPVWDQAPDEHDELNR